MSEIIRIPNIENYIQEIINGELILTPKNLKNCSDDECNNEENARQMFLEYHLLGRLSEQHESEIIEFCEYDAYDEQREFLKGQVGLIHQKKIMINKKFVKIFGEKLWNDLKLEYGYQ
jgi:hypothetical protein